ncbi:vesicular integral-membrane protein VIP36-like [Liolophura sinensis]|uniref:vesicular integral-membrane protein VIP36-like n=1 Tax=Liolophura sinensis TaxID=3198878 RepID=UPI003158D46F
MNVPLWDFYGSTMVTNNFIRLTSDRQSQQGSIWNSLPCFIRNWELHVHFKVHGSGKSLFGDGFAIWYTRDRMQPGPVFGSKDFFSGLAIFMDTYSNHNGPHQHTHPYISAMVSNGTVHYDHDQDGTLTQLNGCESSFRNKDVETFIAVRYHDNTLKVSTDIEGNGEWKECFTSTGVKLPTGYFFGISAATGELADNHDIISVKLYELEAPENQKDDPLDYSKILPSAQNTEPARDRVDDTKTSSFSGWKLLLLIILIIIGVGVCGMVGFVLYQNKQQHNRKRFY